MKKLDSLPVDIYSLLESGCDLSEEDMADLGEKFSSLMKSRLTKDKSHREFSMSGFGDPCERKQYLKENYPDEGDQIEGRALFSFLYGDVIELLVLFLAKKAGHTVEGEQDEVEFHGLKGHRDAVIDGVLCDVKSANSRSIAKFKNHSVDKDDPFGYIDQLSLYLNAAKDDPLVKVKGEGAFVAVDKELGHIYIDKYKKKDVDYESLIRDKRQVLSADTPPARPYGPRMLGSDSDNRIIPRAPCGYCAFKTRCWADANGGKGLIMEVTSKGPVWHVNKSFAEYE